MEENSQTLNIFELDWLELLKLRLIVHVWGVLPLPEMFLLLINMPNK